MASTEAELMSQLAAKEKQRSAMEKVIAGLKEQVCVCVCVCVCVGFVCMGAPWRKSSTGSSEQVGGSQAD